MKNRNQYQNLSLFEEFAGHPHFRVSELQLCSGVRPTCITHYSTLRLRSFRTGGVPLNYQLNNILVSLTMLACKLPDFWLSSIRYNCIPLTAAFLQPWIACYCTVTAEEILRNCSVDERHKFELALDVSI